MQAIILAAGMGKRLGELTATDTKCMVKVNGVRLIDRLLNQLRTFNLSRIIIVTGYGGDNLKEHICKNYKYLPIVFVENGIYFKTNNIYSLWLAREYMSREETLLLESDLIWEDEILRLAINSPYDDCALVAQYESWMDGTMVRINDDYDIVNFIPKKDFKYTDTDSYYKTVNIYKFSRQFIVNSYLPFLEAYIKVLGENEYYEQVLRVITLLDNCVIKALPVNGHKWYEIDDVQDLRIAETIFASPEERLKKLQHSFGGYWRYPGLLDFCYLVNPYFPQKRMIDEMKANFDNLIRDYPSGMSVNSLLVGKYFGIKEDYAVVGNGASELIKCLMEYSDGKIGMAFPTFEEYPNRLSDDRIVKFFPNNDNFSYDAHDLMDFYCDKDIDTLLLVNPDNPSGNFIKKGELENLAQWCDDNRIRLVIDESFVDFADFGMSQTLLHNHVLEVHSSMCVIKSISKSYGVPGLRLGVLASADTEFILRMKKKVTIWNINSFAEFYMQIYNKYDKDYIRACEKFREERKFFGKELRQIPYLRVIPSQANYFLCEITDRFSSHELTLRLLTDYNILIKDCSAKKGFLKDRQYVRIAIRDRKDNTKLINSLNSYLTK